MPQGGPAGCCAASNLRPCRPARSPARCCRGPCHGQAEGACPFLSCVGRGQPSVGGPYQMDRLLVCVRCSALREVASDTSPWPATSRRALATLEEATTLPVVRSLGFTTPEKRRVRVPPLRATLRSPATTRLPLGSTLVTVAVSCPVKLLTSVVLPLPLYESLPLALASRFSSERMIPLPTPLTPGPLVLIGLRRPVNRAADVWPGRNNEPGLIRSMFAGSAIGVAVSGPGTVLTGVLLLQAPSSARLLHRARTLRCGR